MRSIKVTTDDCMRIASIALLVPSLFLLCGLTWMIFRAGYWRYGLLSIVIIAEMGRTGLVRYVGAGYGLGAQPENRDFIQVIISSEVYLCIMIALFVTMHMIIFHNFRVWWASRHKGTQP